MATHYQNCGCPTNTTECFFEFLEKVASFCNDHTCKLLLSYKPGMTNDGEGLLSDMIGFLASAQGEQTPQWCAEAVMEMVACA